MIDNQKARNRLLIKYGLSYVDVDLQDRFIKHIKDNPACSIDELDKQAIILIIIQDSRNLEW